MAIPMGGTTSLYGHLLSPRPNIRVAAIARADRRCLADNVIYTRQEDGSIVQQSLLRVFETSQHCSEVLSPPICGTPRPGPDLY